MKRFLALLLLATACDLPSAPHEPEAAHRDAAFQAFYGLGGTNAAGDTLASVVLAFGQSNVYGARHGEVWDGASDRVCHVFYVSTWPRTPRRCLYPYGTRYGPLYGFLESWGKAQSDPVLGIKRGPGGTSLHYHWNPSTSRAAAGPEYRKALDMTEDRLARFGAMGFDGRIKGLIWWQGESDADTINAPLYEARLRHLLARLRGDLSSIAGEDLSALPVVIVKIIHRTDIAGRTDIVRAAQQAVCDTDPYAACVDANGYETVPDEPWHIGFEGQIAIGATAYSAFLSLTGGGR